MTSCWPTPDQELLLGACLRTGPDAIDAWRRWRSRVDLDDVDDASFRLLPLLYRALQRHGVGDDVARLAGVYRWHWVRTQLQVRAAARVLDRLAAAGVPTLVLKGGAVGARYYGDHGVRPMDDLDVLVPPAYAAGALAALHADGWRPRRSDVVHRLQFRHSADLQHADGGAVDLHWRVFNEFTGARDEDAASWDAAEPLRLAGRDTRALCPTDELLLACAHGLRWSPVAPIRWLVDVATICSAAGARLDPERLRRTAVARNLVAPVTETAGWLRDVLGLPLPPALDGIATARPRRRDRWAHRVRMAPHRAGERLALHTLLFARRWRRRAPGFAWRSYAAFLACQWELPEGAPPLRTVGRIVWSETRGRTPWRTIRRLRAEREELRARLAELAPRAASGAPRVTPATSSYLCWIDAPSIWQRASDHVRIGGWCLRRDGAPLAGLRACTRQGAVFAARRGRHRPDVAAAFPTLPGAAWAGFVVDVRLGPGERSVRIEARGGDGAWETVCVVTAHDAATTRCDAESAGRAGLEGDTLLPYRGGTA
jgi:hypothetical protein